MSILNICVEVTIVIADGSILVANDKLNTDLFWAVRGGGCNFGVVTEFVYQLHPQRRNVYAGMLVFPASMLDKLVPITAEWWANGNGPSEKEAMVQVMARGPDRTVRPFRVFLLKVISDCIGPTQPCINAAIFYNGSEEDGRANYKRFFDLSMFFYISFHRTS
jgi:FAD/FMN-containing dehydrogenase